MTRLIKTLAILGLLLGLGSPVSAQSGCGGQFGALKFCGTISGGLPGAVLIPPGGTTPIGGNTVLGNPTTSSALPIATIAPILGIPGTSVGSVGFGNATSGTITLQPVTGALGSSVLSLPAVTDTVAGKALANGGTNASLTASNGGILWSNATQAQILAGTATSRQMLQSGATATPAWSTTTWPATSTINRLLFSSAANVIGEISTVNGGVLNANTSGVPSLTVTPVIGVPTTSQGTLGFAGVTSGTATVTAQAAAGTPTITLPNTSGTLADGASSPLALSATTGNLTCATCVTGTSGALTAGTTTTSGYTNTQILGSNGSVLSAYSVNGSGNVVLTTSPTLVTPILGVASGTSLLAGTSLSLGNTNFVSAGSNTATSSFDVGQDSTHLLAINWLWNATPASASAQIATTSFTNPLTVDASILTLQGSSGGQLRIGTNVALTLGSDATGDIFYRNSGGVLTRLPIGSSTNVLAVSGGLPAWTAASVGTITVCGTASSGTCALPYFSAYASAGNTVTTGTPTKISINTKISDSNTWFDAVTNFRYTPLLAGRYLVHVQAVCTGTVVSTCVAQIQKNGSNYAQQQINGGGTTTQGSNVTAIVTMNGTTDFLEAWINNICTGTCSYSSGTGPLQVFFEASFISP